jgi:hypothetical protein
MDFLKVKLLSPVLATLNEAFFRGKFKIASLKWVLRKRRLSAKNGEFSDPVHPRPVVLGEVPAHGEPVGAERQHGPHAPRRRLGGMRERRGNVLKMDSLLDINIDFLTEISDI